MPDIRITKPYVVRRDHIIMYFPTGSAVVSENGRLAVNVRGVGTCVYSPDQYAAVASLTPREWLKAITLVDLDGNPLPEPEPETPEGVIEEGELLEVDTEG